MAYTSSSSVAAKCILPVSGVWNTKKKYYLGPLTHMPNQNLRGLIGCAMKKTFLHEAMSSPYRL